MQIVDVEVRSEQLTPTERATARDSFVRDFEAKFSDWVEIARVCLEVERDRDYEILGYRSFGSWIVAAAPRSRAYLYMVMGRYRELIADIPEEELAKIPLGSAGVLKQLSSKVRQDPEVRKAARKKPSELRQTIREKHPEQHMEGIDVRTLQFTDSQSGVFDEMLAAYRAMNNHESSAEEAVEYLCSGWLDAQWEDSGYSNRQRAVQIGTDN